MRNLQHVGILANMHLYIKHYCNPSDIVIICDGDDSIIGIQTLNILNSVYKDPNTWFVYSSFLMNSPNPDFYYLGPSSKPLNISIK